MGSSARSQVGVNLGFTVVKSLFILLSLRMADGLLTVQVMGLALLFRRQGSLWGNLAQLGASQCQQKFYTANPAAEDRQELWAKLLRWVVLSGVFCILVCTVFSETVAKTLFSSSNPLLAVAFGIYLAGLALGFLATSSWMSEFKFVRSNLIDWLTGSLIFVFCLAIAKWLSATGFFLLLALLTVVASALFLVWFSVQHGFRVKLMARDFKLPHNVVQYGITRSLTSFADMATVVIGPWMLRERPSQAGFLILAYTTLRLAQAVVPPMAQVFALRANSHRHNADGEQRRIAWLCGFVFGFSWVAVALYFLIGSYALELWLPNSHAEVEGVLGELILFMPAICLFYTLRNHIDLRFHFPWNLVTLSACLVGFVISLEDLRDSSLSAIVDASKVMFSFFYIYAAVAVVGILRPGGQRA